MMYVLNGFLTCCLAISLWYANGLRVDNIDKNHKLKVLSGYKKAWEDFNKTHIPETCLPRYPEIEAIYNEGKNQKKH